MGGFKFEQCGNIEGLYLVEPQVFSDERGYNLEAYHAGSFREAGLDMVFVQDNLSMSAKGTLRGMHFQKNYQQGKLVCVVSGEVFDAVVDQRRIQDVWPVVWHRTFRRKEEHVVCTGRLCTWLSGAFRYCCFFL